MTPGSGGDVSSALPRNYLRPCLLLLIAEGTTHGYELLTRLGELGLERLDAGSVYRSLRAMDEDGLVRSTWEPSTSGPARRTYELTAAGRRSLDESAAALREMSRSLAAYDERYEQVAAQHPRVR